VGDRCHVPATLGDGQLEDSGLPGAHTSRVCEHCQAGKTNPLFSEQLQQIDPHAGSLSHEQRPGHVGKDPQPHEWLLLSTSGVLGLTEW
jgi:hypothetical protein